MIESETKMMQVEQTQSLPAGRRSIRLLSKDFAWLLAGAMLLGILIFLGDTNACPAAAALPLAILQLLLGLFYILYVPGYCLTAAFFPAAGDLDGIERVGLSLGLSVSWVSILAPVLDRLPWGLRLWPIFFGELLSILLFMAIAYWRRARQPAGMAYAPEMDWRPRPWWRGLPWLDKRVYLLSAAALLIAGLAAAWIFLVPSDDEFMTEFYILGQEGVVADYPREGEVGEELKVTMGLTNRERVPMTYTVEVWAVDPWADRRELVNTAGPLTLVREQTIQQSITWQMPWTGENEIVDFYLFTIDNNDHEPYRQLRLWMNVKEKKQQGKGGFHVAPISDGE